MPRTNLGRNLAGMALAGLLAFLAGCVPPPAPSPVSRTNLHNTQDGNQIPVTASVTETRYPANDPGGQAIIRRPAARFRRITRRVCRKPTGTCRRKATPTLRRPPTARRQP